MKKPGEILREFLERTNCSPAEFARRCRITRVRVNAILDHDYVLPSDALAIQDATFGLIQANELIRQPKEAAE